MMSIHTVAAGGGSILGFDGARLRVGPESAGANPGPASYRRGGPLAITDANVLLGKHPAGALSRRCSARTATSRWTATAWRAQFEALAAQVQRGHRPRHHARDAGRGLPADRRAEHGQRHQAHLGGARLRRHAVHAAVLRRRRRPACLPVADALGMSARLRAPAGRRAVGLRHGPGRPDRDARGLGRAAAGRRRPGRRRGAPGRRWARAARDELASQGVAARGGRAAPPACTCATRAPTPRWWCRFGSLDERPRAPSRPATASASPS